MMIYYRNLIDKIRQERIGRERELVEKLLSVGPKGD